MKKPIEMHWGSMMDAKCITFDKERKRIDLLLEAKFDIATAVDKTLVSFGVAKNKHSFGEDWTMLTDEFLKWYNEQPRIVYDGFHKVEKLTATIKCEKKSIEKLHIKSAVGALVIDAGGKIGLVTQYRPCTGKYLYEIPAGLMDKEGKTCQQILREELKEECDINANEINDMPSFPFTRHYMVCGSSDAEIALFHVTLNTHQKSKVVEDTDVESVTWVSPESFEQMYYNGDLKDSKTVMAYFYYQNYLMRKNMKEIKNLCK